VDYKPVPTSTSSDPRLPSTTKSSIQVSNNDVANSNVRPRLWSPSWLQELSPQNTSLQTHRQTKDRHLNS
jgi:hypothetical protein